MYPKLASNSQSSCYGLTADPNRVPKESDRRFKSRPFCWLVELVTDRNKLLPILLFMTLSSRLGLGNQSNLYFTLLNGCFMPLPQWWDCYTVGGLEQQAISRREWLEARQGRVWAGFEGLLEFNWAKTRRETWAVCVMCVGSCKSMNKVQSCRKNSLRDWNPGLRRKDLIQGKYPQHINKGLLRWIVQCWRRPGGRKGEICFRSLSREHFKKTPSGQDHGQWGSACLACLAFARAWAQCRQCKETEERGEEGARGKGERKHCD